MDIRIKPQDILVLLKLVSKKDLPCRQMDLAVELGLSQSEVNQAIHRLVNSRLLNQEKKLNRHAIVEFLVHGLKYVFPAQPGAVTRGLPTAHSALTKNIGLLVNERDTYVWATPKGSNLGQSISPLYDSVPTAAGKDPDLYELLAAVDSIRVGRAREVKAAIKILERHLKTEDSQK